MVEIHHAKDIGKKEKINSYVMVTFNGEKKYTNIVYKETTPSW